MLQLDDEEDMGMDVRQHLYLLMKEAINNAVKYSEGTTIKFEITIVKDNLNILIADNGKGFDETAIKGNGLANMQKRAEKINAQLSVKSTKEQGTILQLAVKITQ